MRILVVEDEPKLGRLLVRGLGEEGHPTDLAPTGEEALWMAGAALLRRDRPGRHASGDRRFRHLHGVARPRRLDAGADADRARRGRRPGRRSRRGRRRLPRQAVRLRELLARLRAIARRDPPNGRPPSASTTSSSTRPAPRVAWRRRARPDREGVRAARGVHAPAGERCSRACSCSTRRGIAFESQSNVVDVYIRYLREKVDRPLGRNSIETVRGVGYRLSAG